MTQEEFNKYTWNKKWPVELLQSPELMSRRKRSHSLKIISLDQENLVAEFQSSSKGKTYKTTLVSCTCKDFAMAHGERPCKHILRLAEELNLFSNENFNSAEDDYTVDNRKYFSPQIDITLGRIIEAIAERENISAVEQTHLFLDEAVSEYLGKNNLTFSIDDFNNCELKQKSS